MMEIKTKRLVIMPMAERELVSLIERYKDAAPELSSAYREMLDNCIKYPEQYVWYTSWKICLMGDNEEIGYAGFKGFNKGFPEIGYGINDPYRGNGYATEAVKALCEWAFQMQNVMAVEAEAESGNISSRRVLETNGFVEIGAVGEEGPRYRLEAI